jgi:transcriptional regulator with XRE-family HTH domain
MSPGTYLKQRRLAAALTLDDLALRTETEPPVAAMRRAEWLGLIERDELPVTEDVIDALADVPDLAFDEHALIRLLAIHGGAELALPRLCRVCACSWDDPCVSGDGEACAWVPDDASLCTSCEEGEPAKDTAPIAPMLVGQGSEVAA